MSTIGGNNSIQDGLVFAYDTGNRLNSFKGEPTVNEANTDIKRTIGFHAGDGLLFDEAPEKGLGWKKIIINNTTTNNRILKFPYINHPDTITKTYSVEIDFNGLAGYYVKCDGYGGSGSTIYDGEYAHNTFTATGGGATSIFVMNNNTSRTGLTDTIYYRNYQVEQKPYPTPFTPDTRTATDSLLDLTKNTTIDVTNTSFDSDGMFFDGVSDYVDLGSDTVFKSSGGWTVETITYYNYVPGPYTGDNTSPGNFIGHDANIYNSWYWSVLNYKLALWNKSPGVWKYGSTIIQPNQYYHTVLTCSPDGTSYQMYLNGEPEGGDHVGYSWNPIYAGLSIRYFGAGQAPSTRMLNGENPIAKIYNKALTPQEVKRNFGAVKSRFNIT